MIYKDSHRNTQPELMDDPNINPEVLDRAVEDINRVNTLLGGFKFTLNEVKKHLNTDQPLRIVDFGCGDGAMLRYLAKHLPQSNLEFIGIDLSPRSIVQAIEKSSDDERLRFRESDITTIHPDQLQADILITTLTLHHFSDDQIVKLLKKFKEITTTVIIINDLHRNKLAFLFFKWFSPIFRMHEISIHDGLISIASGFKATDFKTYASKAGITNHSLKWKWSYRYIWTINI